MSKVLNKPSIRSIMPFDPSSEYIVDFLYSGDQIAKNHAVIVDNSTSTIKYEGTQNGSKLQHVIPKNVLEVGHEYLIQIQVIDDEGYSSELSDAVLFYCLSIPTFEFENINDGSVIKNASVTLNLKYVQKEGEKLKSFQFMKYSSDKALLESSPICYYSPSSSLSYSFYKLDNGSTYYFRAIGETARGIILDTGYVGIKTEFNKVPSNVLLDLENNYKEGYVSLRLNINTVEYELKKEDYSLEDGVVDIKKNDLIYKNINIDGDFSLFLEAKELPINKKFLTTEDNIFSLSIINVCGVYYCKLEVKDSLFVQYEPIPKAILVSNSYIKIDDNTIGNDVLIGFTVKRKNSLYGLQFYYKQKE